MILLDVGTYKVDIIWIICISITFIAYFLALCRILILYQHYYNEFTCIAYLKIMLKTQCDILN